MADLSTEDFEAFIAAAATRLQAIRPAMTREVAEAYAESAVPPVATEGPGLIVLTLPGGGQPILVELEDFDPYRILEALEL